MSQAHDTDRTKFDERDYSIVCVCCGQTFEASRSDASFCSARCRVRYSRKPAQRQRAVDEIGAMRLRLHQIQNDYGDYSGFEKALQELSGAVSFFLQDVETAQELRRK